MKPTVYLKRLNLQQNRVSPTCFSSTSSLHPASLSLLYRSLLSASLSLLYRSLHPASLSLLYRSLLSASPVHFCVLHLSFHNKKREKEPLKVLEHGPVSTPPQCVCLCLFVCVFVCVCLCLIVCVCVFV